MTKLFHSTSSSSNSTQTGQPGQISLILEELQDETNPTRKGFPCATGSRRITEGGKRTVDSTQPRPQRNWIICTIRLAKLCPISVLKWLGLGFGLEGKASQPDDNTEAYLLLCHDSTPGWICGWRNQLSRLELPTRSEWYFAIAGYVFPLVFCLLLQTINMHVLFIIEQTFFLFLKITIFKIMS